MEAVLRDTSALAMRARCDWCGMEVEVMASGRCLLGHPIGAAKQVEEHAAEGGSPPSFPPPRDLAPRRRARRGPEPPVQDAPRSIRTAPTPERTLRPVPPIEPAETPGTSASAIDGLSEEPLPVVARISRPWAPVEPDGPSGPVGEQDPWLLRSVPAPEPEPVAGAGAEAGTETGTETGAGGVPAGPEPGRRPSHIEYALRDVLAERERPASEPETTSSEPLRRAPTLPGPAPEAQKRMKPRLRMPFARRPDARPPVERPAAAAPARTLKPVPPAPKTAPKVGPKAASKAGSKAGPAPMLEAILSGRPAAEEPIAKPSKPKAKPAKAVPATAGDEPTAQPTLPSQSERPPGIAPGTRNPPPPAPRRLTAPTPRNTVAWGLAIAATFVAGVAALVLSPGRAEDTRPTVRRIALTSVPGHTVQHDPETESRLRAELGAQRAVPRQLSAATIRNGDGDIVALYQAIVFNDDVAATQRDTDDFIALFAEGAGVSADSFAERPLGDRMIWSGLLDQGQAILLFRGPEVVIVITATTGADGDNLADAILTARGA